MFFLANELNQLVFDSLAFPALMALSLVSRSFRLYVHQYLGFKLRMVFHPFGIKFADLLEKLELVDALIVGTMALKVVEARTVEICCWYLDIVVDEKMVAVMRTFLEGCNYTLTPSITTPTDFPVRNRQSFERQHTTNTTFINLIVVTRPYLYHVPFYTSNSTLMNTISRHGIFCPYPSLTDGWAIHNNMRYMWNAHEFFNFNTSEFDEHDELANAIKLSQRFTFISNNERSHFGSDWCSCLPLACPAKWRETTSDDCAIMKILFDEALDRIPSTVGAPAYPEISWRLAQRHPWAEGCVHESSQLRWGRQAGWE